MAVIFWATYQMPVTAGDTLKEILRPLTSCLVAVGIVLACSSFIHPIRPPLLRLFVENGVLFGVYFIVLGFVMGQKNIYLPMLRTSVFGLSSNGGGKPPRSLPRFMINRCN